MENEEIVESSGNIFEDLDFPNAEEAQAKSKLAIEIFLIIKAKKLTQKEAAKIMKTAQSHVSDILRGKLSHFTIDRLLRCLLALGKDVEIKIKQPKTKKQPPRIYVSDGEKRGPLVAKSPLRRAAK
jgi:predicted XRE-type DNA-binding protein